VSAAEAIAITTIYRVHHANVPSAKIAAVQIRLAMIAAIVRYATHAEITFAPTSAPVQIVSAIA